MKNNWLNWFNLVWLFYIFILFVCIKPCRLEFFPKLLKHAGCSTRSMFYKKYLYTMVYLINMQHVLLIFWKNQACMVLLHPACFINFGKNSSLHGLLHPISSENHHSSHYFASKLTLMVKNWMECSLKTYSFNHMMS